MNEINDKDITKKVVNPETESNTIDSEIPKKIKHKHILFNFKIHPHIRALMRLYCKDIHITQSKYVLQLIIRDLIDKEYIQGGYDKSRSMVFYYKST